jgi:magnesium transporter
MKVLTIISTIFIPLTFISSIYGMNFDRGASRWSMPELGWAWGYPAVMALMLVTALALLLYFRRRGWLGGTAFATPAESPRADVASRADDSGARRG